MTKSDQKDIARDISYAHGVRQPWARVMIRSLEAAGGRGRLLKRAAGYQDDVANGENFWASMARRYGLEMEFISGSLDLIPKDRPVIVVANHPFGILDGLILGFILSQARDDFRIMAHRVFQKAEDINRIILPINFDGTRAAALENASSRLAAGQWLRDGGILGIFPGATVSTSTNVLAPAYDPSWHRFPTKLLTRSEAVVVPVYFEGANSRLFQFASHVHQEIRRGLLIREFSRRVDGKVRLAIGEPIERDAIEPLLNDPIALKSMLRRHTYELGGINAPNGFEFDAIYRGGKS